MELGNTLDFLSLECFETITSKMEMKKARKWKSIERKCMGKLHRNFYLSLPCCSSLVLVVLVFIFHIYELRNAWFCRKCPPSLTKHVVQVVGFFISLMPWVNDLVGFGLYLWKNDWSFFMMLSIDLYSQSTLNYFIHRCTNLEVSLYDSTVNLCKGRWILFYVKDIISIPFNIGAYADVSWERDN